MSANEPTELERIYSARFQEKEAYRLKVWAMLLEEIFQPLVKPTDQVLDLGCGYGEFINQVRCAKKFGMDLNPKTAGILDPSVTFLQQDCSQTWQVPANSLDVVFTSNFFEHLPDKMALGKTLDEAKRCLRPGGRLIALGPNIKYLAAQYWDFWDHHLPLSDIALGEGLTTRGFEIEQSYGKFLPYTMVRQPKYPTVFLRWYLRLKPAWSIFGRQFLVIAAKTGK